MKFTTSAALAVAATGAAAQDSWSAWSSASSSSAKPATASSAAKSCPAPETTVETKTTTVYQSTSEVYTSTTTVPVETVTVAASGKPASAPSGAAPSSWVNINWDMASPRSTVSECQSGKTVTKTSTVTSTIAGTTTVTKGVLFVGAQATGSSGSTWADWNGVSNAQTTGGSKGSDNASGSGSGSGSGNFWGGNAADSASSSSAPSHSWSGGQGSDNSDNDNGDSEWGQGSWGGKGTGGLELGSGDAVFHWTPSEATNTVSGIAPIYTKGPNGWSGLPFGGIIDGIIDAVGDVVDDIGDVVDDIGDALDNWGDNNDSDSDNNGNSSGGHGGYHNSTTPANNSAGGKNGTQPATNATAPTGDYGSESSNVTKPYEPLKDSECNSAGDRSKWCGNLDIDTDYYKDYFNEGKSSHFGAGAGFGGTCDYDLVITNGTWNQDGQDVMTFLINGQYPGPAIECNWGDLVTINVHNQLENNGTAIHWHGVRHVGTNDQDGVPGVTECAIAPGQSRTYTWRATSYGTSWYHSHWNLQYGDGVQGPIIIHGPATANYDVDAGPVMITDTFGMTATQFGSILAHVGPQNTVNYLMNGKNTKPDLSAGQHSLWKVQKGKKYLFRIINSAAQNMWSVSIDQHKMQVIAADFVPIVPYETEWLNIGVGQRYDVVVEMDQAVDTYFFRAVTQTLCPSGSANSGLSQANGIIAYEGVHEHPIYLPTSTLNGGKTANDFKICQDEPLASLVPHLKKDAGTKSAFQASASTLPGGTVSKVGTADDGAVFRWFLNNGAMYVNYTQPTIQSINDDISLNSSVYANSIVLKQKNQWVYFAIQNQFFAFHPMHLHGHDFSILGQGDGLFTADLVDTLNFDNPIRRDTAMLAGAAGPGASSGGYTVIGFETDNPGAWLMHCHIAWHIDGGLGLQWIERPDEMTASGYTSQSEFDSECSTYAQYEASFPADQKTSGQSGLRRKDVTYFDRILGSTNSHAHSVVRRDSHGAHHFLDAHAKRGLGDGAHRRSFGRRR